LRVHRARAEGPQEAAPHGRGQGARRHHTPRARGHSQLFKDGTLIPVDQWPEEIADAVKAIKHTPFGPTTVMYSKLRALELMAIAGGELKQKHERKHAFDLAAYLGAEPPAEDEE
jgi:hypothetical protein